MFVESLVPVSVEPEVKLFVARSDGPAERTLLVIHGGPDWDHTYLRRPLDELAGTCRVVLPDLRGCGRSTSGLADDQYTPDAVVSDLVALLDSLEVDDADVLGFSYGGLIAQRLAITAPRRVRRLIVASSSVLPVSRKEEKRWDGDTRSMAVAGAATDVWRPQARAEYLQRLEGVRFSEEWLRPLRKGILPSPRVDDAPRRLAALRIPLLLLHGRQDTTFPAELVDQALRLIPAARAVVLDEAGHMAHVDQPKRWLDAVVEHLT
ncbi:alpha/beta fold hydrolase [Allokutzneria oryzae]|uniref:Alpha/beta fold hydrolase n=1 Tax=Allokutzneria oryzae TaxID=1378989 RepID=A0ABV6A5Z6_9PSEU